MKKKTFLQHEYRIFITEDNQYDDATWERVIISFARLSNINMYYLEGVYSTFYIHFKYTSVAEEAFEHVINISMQTGKPLGNIAGTVIADMKYFKKRRGFL